MRPMSISGGAGRPARSLLNIRTIVIGLACVALVVVVAPSLGVGRPGGLRGTRHRQYPVAPTEPEGARASLWSKTDVAAGAFRVAIVADLDKQSKDKGAKKPTFHSEFKEGTLSRGADGRWSMAWDRETVLTSQHSEAGRGMELSELVKWHGRLYTMDDRSGIVFELYSKGSAGSGAGKLVSVPRWILMEGDGNAAKGQKTEWATVKDDVLYTGSFGKEYVGADGGITSLNNLWVSTVDAQGTISHEDWTDEYNAMRKETNSLYPGYMIIETILWSPIKRKWFVLPRRVSSEPYDEVADEKRGDNIVIVCNEDFTEVSSFRVGVKTPERGFSSAKFLPGSGDNILVALKSEENEAQQTQGTYLTIFDTDGNTLLAETEVPGGHKYEGLEFV